MSSGDSDSEGEFEEENSLSSVSTAISEDEFAEESITEKQTMRRELVLGRPTPAILHMRPVELSAMHLAYMKQLDDADEELAELTGFPTKQLCGVSPYRDTTSRLNKGRISKPSSGAAPEVEQGGTQHRVEESND
ncbi:hypothetical protein B0H13DRAFT_2307652 [Mycena leptocephala]|nr:hypothetical protein B0H13DRAFT_2307652 [Mycena leptocephala]